MCGHVHLCEGAHGDQKRASRSLEAVVPHSFELSDLGAGK